MEYKSYHSLVWRRPFADQHKETQTNTSIVNLNRTAFQVTGHEAVGTEKLKQDFLN